MKLARADRQELLLQVRPSYKVGTNALNRNAYGFAAQEIVCAALCLRPIRINGQYSVCLDAERDDYFFEIKSCLIGSKLVIYNCRFEKELSVPKPVYYAILGHSIRKASTSDLISLFASRPLELFLTDLATLQQLLYPIPAYVVTPKNPESKRNGYNREGYRDGYKLLPYKELRSVTRFFGCRRFSLYGVEFNIALRKTNV